MAASGLFAACGDQPPGHEYDGPIAPCEVALSADQPGAAQFEPARPSAAPDYWKDGPYGVWNTSPAPACAGDPVIEEVGGQQDVSLYMTYPAAGQPTVTGLGDVAPGTWPVIIFAHANSDRECNIYRRYFSLHDHWASWGFVVAAVDGTYTDCRPGTTENIEKRIQGQLAAIDKLAALNADPDSRFYGRIDLDTIIFAGHSRGGGASLEAARRSGRAAGVIDFQGIDLTAFGFGDRTLPGFPVVGFTAGEDVDLNYPIVEPTEDQLGGPYSWVNINGAIHAHTADTVPIEPDDEPLISRSAQHQIGEYYTTAFLARWVGVGDGHAGAEFVADPAAGSILYGRRGARVVDDELSDRGVFQRWRAPGEIDDDETDDDDIGDAETDGGDARGDQTIWIDHFDGDTPDHNQRGGQNVSRGFRRSAEVPTYRPDRLNTGPVYAGSVSRLLEADDAATFRIELDQLAVPADAAADTTVQARVKGPDDGHIADFQVRIELADGTTEVYPGADIVGPEALSNRFTQLIIPGDDIAGQTLSAIEFEVSDGAVFLDDLRIRTTSP